MRRYERKQITETRDVLVEHTCDWCGGPMRPADPQSIYEKDTFLCEWETGESYPEGGSGPRTEIELCQQCRPKFFTMLAEQGIKVQHGEWES